MGRKRIFPARKAVDPSRKNYWEILEQDVMIDKYVYAFCRCECGIKRLVLHSNIKRGISTNCGCKQERKASRNRLTVSDRKYLYFVWWKKKDLPDWPQEWKTLEDFINSIAPRQKPLARFLKIEPQKPWGTDNYFWYQN